MHSHVNWDQPPTIADLTRRECPLKEDLRRNVEETATRNGPFPDRVSAKLCQPVTSVWQTHFGEQSPQVPRDAVLMVERHVVHYRPSEPVWAQGAQVYERPPLVNNVRR